VLDPRCQIRLGSKIVEVNGIPVASMLDIGGLLRDTGREVELTVQPWNTTGSAPLSSKFTFGHVDTAMAEQAAHGPTSVQLATVARKDAFRGVDRSTLDLDAQLYDGPSVGAGIKPPSGYDPAAGHDDK
jgi:hypothetical protein